ncbi:hypothetical protein PVAND_015259 [Polypedilum vanderplanki]|uniref:Uncharacterized protein n=1 Tax=Polypedilum vanderplanki TaxID=319348 RepID=A0A9J6BCI3_POLVA|nr:hypothetical protein PVAND_015259 [Polypedilum vanderplanki]
MISSANPVPIPLNLENILDSPEEMMATKRSLNTFSETINRSFNPREILILTRSVLDLLINVMGSQVQQVEYVDKRKLM